MRRAVLYFLADLAANTLAGAWTGLLCAAVLPASWPHPFAMIAGMLLGMVVILPIELAASLWLGAFEVMLPMMLTGMTAGMVIPMAAMDGGLSWSDASVWGAASGVGALVFCTALNAFLRGQVRQWSR